MEKIPEAIGWGMIPLLMRISALPGYRYGVALLLVGAALVLSLLVQPSLPDGFLVFFLSAVMLAGWFGRTGAGLFAVVVSMVAVGYYFIAPYRAFGMELDEIPYFLSFLLSAVVTSWLASARKDAEEKQRAHLNELFEQTPEAIMLIDLRDRVLRVNKTFLQLFGYAGEEIANSLSIDLIVPAHLKTDALMARERLAAGHDVSMETIRKRKDGTYLEVSEVSFPVVAGGVCIAYYLIFRDITESKRASEELQKARAGLAHLSRITTMGELAASIAHEINQPIGAVVTNGNAAMRFLGQRPANLAEAQNALECIVRDGNRAADVIGRIRSLFNKNPTPMVRLDINEIIYDVLALANQEISRSGAVVATELTSPLPSTLGDPVQLQQVMLNLIMNSLDAMSSIADRPRRLRIKSSRNPDCVLVQVEDSGQGWEPQHANRIFDAFFTTKEDGIGMGLTISRSIIEAHGGRLWAERSLPHGAILSFTLPILTGSE